jgi:Anti-sigma-K factor rskA, C-terminal
MSTSDCPRIDDAAPYVLHAMDEGEWEAHRYHLADCEACAAKVAELEPVALALLSGVTQQAAPADLRSRVMGIVRSEAELLKAAGPGADRAQPPPFSLRVNWRALRPLPAAVLASVALALGVGAGVLLSGGDDPISQRTVTAQVDATAAPGARAEMRMTSGGGARLVVAGMPAPAEGRIYQVWLDHGSDHRPPLPTDVLFSTSHDGRATVQVPGDLKDVSAVLVTSEPQGGSEIPTRRPVITARV